MERRESFIFYRSFLESIEEARPEEQLQLYRAIALYALNQEEPKLKGLVKSVWLAIKPQLDANFKRYMNGCKGAIHGKKGGAPRGNSNARKQPQNNPKTTPNVNDNVNDNVNVNVDTDRSAPFRSIPKQQDVELFFQKHSNNEADYLTEAKLFFWEFESVGWIDKYGEPINNWRAVATQWIKNWVNLSTQERAKIISRHKSK